MSTIKIYLMLIFASFCIQACATSLTEPDIRPTVAPVQVTDMGVLTPTTRPSQTSTSTMLPSQTLPPFPTATSTSTSVPQPSATLSPQPTASPKPTSAIFRGVVLPEKVSCRYGPGAMYLYLYGMVQTATQDIIGRTDTGNWVLTRSHGDNKACWVKSEFLEIDGDIMTLEVVYPDKFRLPPSNQGYRSPWDVVAIRNGNNVTISWKSEALRPGDEESATSVLYVVETWVCKDGQLIFTPIGAYTPQVNITDEPGCNVASHGRVYFSEKHGYAGPTNINWPLAP